MNCEKIQELLLTDYIDGQLDPKWKSEVDNHVAGCVACREFAATARKTAVEPFLRAETFRPPEQVWMNIKGTALAGQKVPPDPLAEFWQRVSEFIHVPRPAFAFAVVLIMAVMVGGLTRLTVKPKIDPTGQIEYLSALLDPVSDPLADEENGLGTSVEQYFL